MSGPLGAFRRRRGRRRLERAFVRGAMDEQLRSWLASSEQARTMHDALHAPLRALSPDDVSAYEIDEVGRWLEADAGSIAGSDAVDPVGTRPGWRLLAGTLALAAVTVVGLVWGRGWGRDAWTSGGPELADAEIMELVARGGAGDGGLALEVFCAPSVRFARPDGCHLDEAMTFGMRHADASGGGYVALFGIDADGDVAYYAPTPAGDGPIPVSGPGWHSTEFSVRLATNHAEGPLQVFAVRLPAPVEAHQVDAWATAIRRAQAEPTGTSGPWTRWAGLDGSPPCDGVDGGCPSAHLTVSILPPTTTGTDRP